MTQTAYHSRAGLDYPLRHLGFAGGFRSGRRLWRIKEQRKGNGYESREQDVFQRHAARCNEGRNWCGIGLDNGQPFPSLGKLDKPRQNADGSTDLYIGPKAPAGKEGNWLATVPGRGFFAILRLYLPTGPAIDGSWKPGDVEKVY